MEHGTQKCLRTDLKFDITRKSSREQLWKWMHTLQNFLIRSLQTAVVVNALPLLLTTTTSTELRHCTSTSKDRFGQMYIVCRLWNLQQKMEQEVVPCRLADTMKQGFRFWQLHTTHQIGLPNEKPTIAWKIHHRAPLCAFPLPVAPKGADSRADDGAEKGPFFFRLRLNDVYTTSTVVAVVKLSNGSFRLLHVPQRKKLQLT